MPVALHRWRGVVRHRQQQRQQQPEAAPLLLQAVLLLPRLLLLLLLMVVVCAARWLLHATPALLVLLPHQPRQLPGRQAAR
jgi:hypothetical protein